MTVLFPTFEELLHPQTIDTAIRERAAKARNDAPLDPINLFNINWQNPHPPLPRQAGEGKGGGVNYFVMPHAITGVDAEIVVMVAKDFPTGSHKVGAGVFRARREVRAWRD